MRRFCNSIFLLAALGACTPLSIYYKPGGSVARMQQDTANCYGSALKTAPINNQVRQNPPVYIPGRTVCNSNGNCYQTAGYWVPGSVYTVDVNKSRRNALEDQCMARRGYAPITLPECTPAEKTGITAARTTKLPQTIPPKSCAVHFTDGSFQIITPG